MIEAYAFLAVFTVQILAMSVLCPSWFIRFVRAKTSDLLVERCAQLYPGVDLRLNLERWLARYRVVNAIIALLGGLLLGWLFSYMQRADWDDGPVETLAGLYFMLQALPLVLVALIGLKYRGVLKKLREGKRTAVLQRRGLFDFVAPFTVFLAVLSYFLFAGLVIYINRDPFPGFAGYINIGGVTLIYAMNAFGIYKQLYGRKFDPAETHAHRLYAIGLGVKVYVYACIAVVAFLSLNFTLVLLDLQRWEPFAQSVYLTVCALLSFRGFTAPLRKPTRHLIS
jgi:hypothetical protein